MVVQPELKDGYFGCTILLSKYDEIVRSNDTQNQCDQMARLLVQYWTISNTEYLPIAE